MTWDIIVTLSFMFSIFTIWIQRKTIFQLELDIWELEKTYKELTGKPYQYLHRQLQLQGNDKKIQKEGQL